jgi:hypothetical protein
VTGWLRRSYPALPWVLPFGLVLGILLVMNSWLFTTPVYEDGDMGAYSIQIEQARRFRLLVGNYSREKFNHPGPAFLYVESWGEDLFYAMDRLVPTAWNGQVLGLYLLTSFFAACAVVIAYRWGGWRAAIVMLGGLGLLGVLHPLVFSSSWMPYAYVPAYLLFVVSAASVAAGRSRDAWMAAVSGWFLIHGHACFLLFVPLLSGGVIAFRLLPYLRRRTWPRVPRGVWVPVAVISALFLVPILAELVRHWPGNFGKYFSYSSSGKSGAHPTSQVVAYILWFWWPSHQPSAWLVVIGLVAVAVAAVWWMPRGPVRRLCAALLGIDALSSVGFAVYAFKGIDQLNQHYIGYFYWTGPLLAVLAIALAATEMIAARRLPQLARGVVTALVLAGFVGFAVVPSSARAASEPDPTFIGLTGSFGDPSLPAAVARVGALADGRYAVLSFHSKAWPTVTGFLVQAERTGVRACVANPGWAFMMTEQLVCTRGEIQTGKKFEIWVPGTVPAGTPVVFSFGRGIVTYGTS